MSPAPHSPAPTSPTRPWTRCATSTRAPARARWCCSWHRSCRPPAPGGLRRRRRHKPRRGPSSDDLPPEGRACLCCLCLCLFPCLQQGGRSGRGRGGRGGGGLQRTVPWLGWAGLSGCVWERAGGCKRLAGRMGPLGRLACWLHVGRAGGWGLGWAGVGAEDQARRQPQQRLFFTCHDVHNDGQGQLHQRPYEDASGWCNSARPGTTWPAPILACTPRELHRAVPQPSPQCNASPWRAALVALRAGSQRSAMCTVVNATTTLPRQPVAS